MSLLLKYDTTKEGLFIGMFFLTTGFIFLLLNYLMISIWFQIAYFVLFAIAGMIIITILLLQILQGKKSGIFLWIWNELFYLFIGIPLIVLCILIIPIVIYILFFEAVKLYIYIVFLSSLAIMQLGSIIYMGIQIWQERRPKKEKAPVKPYKPPIESLLFKNQ